MKAESVNLIKKKLLGLEPHELTALCLRLIKYKKENKELLSYLLFESDDESAYIESVKLEMFARFDELSYFTSYQTTKQIRKIYRFVAKQIKYSALPATQVELLIHFCQLLKKVIQKYRLTALENMYAQQLKKINIALSKLHEDIQYDYAKVLNELEI
jgi:hypothetical protein